MISVAEENYLKAVYKLQGNGSNAVPTGALANAFGIQAPSVTDMVKKLDEKALLRYEKSKGVRLTAKGRAVALTIVRKHRIWETFLVQTLEYGWDQVHELAEQLEHIQSEDLIDRLEGFLGYPKFDPHGDPIPDKNGKIQVKRSISLKQGVVNKKYRLTGITEDSAELLQYLSTLGLVLGSVIGVIQKMKFDSSMVITVDEKKPVGISAQVAAALLVHELN